jgi:hypothetical protein
MPDHSQFEKLIRKFEKTAGQFPYFPVYLREDPEGTDEEGEPNIPLSITMPSGVDPRAKKRLKELAKDAVPLLRRCGINPDHPSCATDEGRWLFWVFFDMRGLARGEWENAPVSKTNPAEHFQLSDNVFYTSAVTLMKLQCQQAQAEPHLSPIQKLTLDKEAQAIALLFTVGANAAEIAREIGVKRTTLLGWKGFKKAYDLVKAGERAAKDRAKAKVIPRGLGRSVPAPDEDDEA